MSGITEEQVIELIRHPLVRRTIRSLANAEAQSIIKQYMCAPDAQVPTMDYREAARYSGLAYQTIRHYVSTNKLTGGDGWVTVASLEQYMRQAAGKKKSGRRRKE